MRNKNILTLIFLFLFLIVPTMAQPPFQGSGQTDPLDDELVVINPKNEYIAFNETYIFHAHVTNSSGYLLNNTLVDCVLHVYEANGSHIVETDLLKDSNDYDLYWTFTNSYTDNIGFLPYNLFCNTSTEGGFLSSYLIVTEDGNEKDKSAGALSAMIALIPLIFGLFMIIGAATLGKDHDVLRIVLFLMSPITIFVSFHFAMIGIVRYYGLYELQEAIGSTTYWMSWWFFVLVAYFIIYGIWKWADTVAQKKNERMNY